MFDPVRILARCDSLAAITATPGAITRVNLTPQHAEANRLVAAWMAEAGLKPHVDAAGNVIGERAGGAAGAKALVLGSHLDTVRNAGRYDGILGVVLAIEVAAVLKETPLPFPLVVAGFADEEGTRFGASLIGSRAFAGTFDPAWLVRRDADGVSIAEAMRAFGLDPQRAGDAAMPPDGVRAYLEVHIEQGPLLEEKGLPVGVVTAICGSTRKRYHVSGVAGHAGTVPMPLRHDALAGAAEIALAAERVAREAGIVATVGCFEVLPGAVNVIPGAATFSLDIRSAENSRRLAVLAGLEAEIAAIAARRGLAVSAEMLDESSATPCDPGLRDTFAAAIAAEGLPVEGLPSGAGHDGTALAPIAPIAMLFVRCAGGVSHSPDEAISGDDAAIAARVLHRTVLALAARG